jgi:hypothetical protein
MDMTKIANFALYAIENDTASLNDKKLSIMLFLIDNESVEKNGAKIFGDQYIKSARNPEPKQLTDIFEIIANDEDLEDDDERLYMIQELLAFVDIEIFDKKSFVELKFSKFEEEFDPSIFTKDELSLIDDILAKYKDMTPRNIANACFKIEKVRQTPNGEVII